MEKVVIAESRKLWHYQYQSSGSSLFCSPAQGENVREYSPEKFRIYDSTKQGTLLKAEHKKMKKGDDVSKFWGLQTAESRA